MTSFAIIGCGALGGLYGAYLHQAGYPVHFLLHSDYDHVGTHGFRVDSIWGDLHLYDIPIYNSSEQMPKVDVVCVCLKSTENHLIKDIITPLLHDNMLILFLQNGIGVEEEISCVFPQQQIAGGLAFLCSNKIGPGHIHHLDYGPILLGAHSPNLDLEPLTALFNAARIPTELSPSLAAARWQKLIWNIPYNGLCALHDMDTSLVMANPALRQSCEEIMHEVFNAAAACGSTLDSSVIAKMLRNTEKMKPYMPSMQLDRQHKRPMEIKYMYQRPIQMGKDAGVAMPQTAALCEALLHLQLNA